MRRRRRQSTQIIRKKTIQSPATSPHYSKPRSGTKWKKVLYGFLTIIILGLISYYFYQWGLPGKSQSDTASLQEETIDSVVDTQETKQDDEDIAPLEHKIQIEILNGCGVNGVAKIFQSILREEGFDVVNTENYTLNGKLFWQVENSFVIDQIGVFEYAKVVAKAIGIPAENIENRENPAAIYEVSIVIGKDYKKYIRQ